MNNQQQQDLNKEASRIAYLIAGYVRQSITEAEHDELDDWVNENDHNMQLFEELTDDDNIAANMEWMDKVNSEASYQRLKESGAFDLTPKRKSFKRVWMVAATVILLVAAFVLYKYTSNKKPIDKEDTVHVIQPGSGKATLTLEDGTVMDLTTAGNGVLVNKDSIAITKTSEGGIVYSNQDGKIVQHTLTTPIGGQYQVTLPDGTKVWLNAASSLSYPSQFSHTQRNVILTGEGYFEVAKDLSRPFHVLSSTVNIEVLGTHFNMNTYKDEPSFTATLLEGSIAISNGGVVKKLVPGQQADITNGAVNITTVDTNAVVAWKHNEFRFHNSTIETIMRQVQRWYGAQIVYQDKVSYHFNATVDRSEPLDKLLFYLEGTGHIHFKKEKNTIIIMK